MRRKIVLLTFIFAFVAFVTAAKAGEKASNPIPMDGAGCVDPDVVLSWAPGEYAATHHIFFGIDYDLVANRDVSTYRASQEPNSYNPGGLQVGVTYYWCIDESNDSNTWAGDVWRFTTSVEDCNCISAPPDMVAWWPLDEDSTPGGVSHDIVNYNHGIWYGSPTPVTGKVAGALDFNGVTDYVEVPNHASLNFGTDKLSVDAWVKTSDASGTYVILDKRSGPMLTMTGYVLFIYNGNLWLQLGHGTGNINYPSSLSVANGNWNHVAATLNRNDSNGVKLYVNLYVNGVSQTFNPTTWQGCLDNNGNLLIGSDRYFSSHRFDGSIDEVELFNRALDADEVLAIYAIGPGGKCKDCNRNGIPDHIDITNGTSKDCNGNGIPDECEPDCNGNGIPDDCECWRILNQGGGGGLSISEAGLPTWQSRAWLLRGWWQRDGDELWGGKGDVVVSWENRPKGSSLTSGSYENACINVGLMEAEIERTRSRAQNCTHKKPRRTYNWNRFNRQFYEAEGVGTDVKDVEINLSFDEGDRYNKAPSGYWIPVLQDIIYLTGEIHWCLKEYRACVPGLFKTVGRLLEGIGNIRIGEIFDEKFKSIGKLLILYGKAEPQDTCAECPPETTLTCTQHELAGTVRGPARVQILWEVDHFSANQMAGQLMTSLGPPGSGNHEEDMTQYEFGQRNGSELWCRARVHSDADLMKPFGPHVREFLFLFDIDNNPNTGDPSLLNFRCGADYYVNCRMWTQFIDGYGDVVISDSNVYGWCEDHWEPTGERPHELEPLENAVKIVVGLKDIGICQTNGLIASWVVVELDGVPMDTTPDDVCGNRYRISIGEDNKCPIVESVNAKRGEDNSLEEIHIEFSEPVMPVTPDDVDLWLPGPVPVPFSLRPQISGVIVLPSGAVTFERGLLTLVLHGNTIMDTSGNRLRGNFLSQDCGTPFEVELCSPDTGFYAANERGTKQDEFGPDDSIYVKGSSFPADQQMRLYLVLADSIQNDGDILIDMTKDGWNVAVANAQGDLALTNIGKAVRNAEYWTVSDLNKDGIYQRALDRVHDLCGLGLVVGSPCENPIPDIQAWWPLDEAAGALAALEPVAQNHAFYRGSPTAVTGVVSGGLSFDGVDDYLEATDDVWLNFDTNDGSIDAWVFLPTDSDIRSIVDKFDSPNNVGYALSASNNNALTFQMGDGSITGSFVSTGSVPMSQWAHVAVTFDRDMPGGGVFYINGQPAGTFDPSPIQGSIDSNEPLWIGRSHGSGQPYFRGKMDEVNLFDRALPPDHVKFIYDAGDRGKCEEDVPGDINEDQVVDWRDLKIMADEWLSDLSLADLYQADGQHIVNFRDFCVVAEKWLMEGIFYGY
jgi:hypothetical protein